jgi:hypothetical protein
LSLSSSCTCAELLPVIAMRIRKPVQVQDHEKEEDHDEV